MIIYQYRIKAVGFGFGLARYPLNFTILSNYDIKIYHEEVMNKVRRRLKKEWGTAYEIISVRKKDSL